MRMFRWKYIVPRLVLLGGLWMCLWLAMNPLLRWTMILGGQQMTGAKVEISVLRTLLSRSELRLSDVAFADPQAPMQNAMQAEQAILDVDIAALSRRRFVVNRGQLRGIRFGNARKSTGALPGLRQPESNSTTWLPTATEAGEEWLEDAAEKLGTRLESDLESVALGRELMERWPEDYQLLEQDVRAVRDRGERVLKALEETKRRPLQSVEHYQGLLADLDAVRRDSLEMRQRFAKLRQQMQLDRAAVEQARQHDRRYLEQQLKLAKLEPEAVSDYLLGPEWSPRINRLLHWLQWGRTQISSGRDAEPLAQRGWTLALPQRHASPTLLVRKLMLDGAGLADGKPFQFSGSLKGLTNQPSRYGKPTVLNMSSQGSMAMTIHAILDHTRDIAQDKIVIDCPQLAQPACVLGAPEKLSVSTTPGTGQLLIDINVTGSQLDGTVQFEQRSVELSTEVGEAFGGQLISERLSASVSEIHDLIATIRVGGTLQSPAWTIESNLGSQLAAGLGQVWSQELEHRQQQLLAIANAELDEQLSRIQQEVTSQQDELWAKLSRNNSRLEAIKSELAGGGLSGKLLGKEGLLKNLLR